MRTVLYLDKEGGFGGSSRSLYFLIASLDRCEFRPLVVSREPGPIRQRYESIEVDHQVFDIPILKAGRRKNLLVLLLFLLRIPQWLGAMRRLGRMVESNGAALIHLNHDGFFPIAIWNRIFWKKPLICHVRTMIPQNWFGRWQVRILAKTCDKLVCISTMERARIESLLGDAGDQEALAEVIHNVGDFSGDPAASSGAKIPPEWESRFKVIWLGNISHSKGTDRVLEVAMALKAEGRTDIVFLICGEERKPSRPPLLPDLASAIRQGGLTDMVKLMGFVEAPQHLIRSSNVVLRTSRSNDPWGRDIIEGLVQGKPILATGGYSPFVTDGVNGFLFEKFSAIDVADALKRLADKPQLYSRVSLRNRFHGQQLFSGKIISRQISDLYTQVLSANQ